MTRLILAAALLAWPTMSHAQLGTGTVTSQPEEPRSWHLLQRQGDNLIRSITHGLTKHECEFAANRVMGKPATSEEIEIETKRQAQSAERARVEREKFLAEHPKCASGSFAPECMLSWGWSNSVVTPYNPTEIRTAECFQ